MLVKFKIGVTERGDAAVHLDEWADKAPGFRKNSVVNYLPRLRLGLRGMKPEITKRL